MVRPTLSANPSQLLKARAIVLALAFAFDAIAQTNIAQNNVIQNGGFDSGSTGWSTSAGGAYFYNQPVGSETDSILSIGWSNGNSFSQNTGVAFQPGIDYVLTVRADVGQSPLTGVMLSLQAANGDLITLTNQSFVFPDQSTNIWRIFSLHVSSNTVAGSVGNTIVVNGTIVENPSTQSGWLWMDWMQLAPALPYFTSQPVGVTTSVGNMASLSAMAIGAVTNSVGAGSVIVYQWYQNGIPLANATNSTLTFAVLNATNAGNYYAVATDPYGSSLSSTVTLAVHPPGGFVVNDGTRQTGVVVGTGNGNDTVTGAGGFTGSYGQDLENSYGSEMININAGANIASPNIQPFVTNDVSTFTANGLTYTNASFHQAVVSFIHGMFTNNGVLNYSNNALPACTALQPFDSFPAANPPMPNGNLYYYYGEGVFVDVDNVQYGGPATIVNGSPTNTNATITSVVTGSGQEIAQGIHAEACYSNVPRAPDVTMLNYGMVSSCSTGCVNGAALAIAGNTLYGGLTVSNGSAATAAAQAPYYTTSLYAFSYYGDVNMSQAGQATAISTGGFQGNAAGYGTAVGMDAFSYNGQINLYNSGTITASATSTGTCNANAVFAWAENDDTNVIGGFNFINTGTISATAARGPGCTNAQASPLYGGCDGGIVNLVNTGTVIGNAPDGGWAWGTENDRAQNIHIYNSGTISHNTGLGVFVYGQPGGEAFITNTATGSIYGGNEGIATENFTGDVTIYDYGSVMGGSPYNNAMDLGPGNDTVHLYGLPNIVGYMNGQGGSNTLDFELTGVLQQVNGNSATLGNNLEAYNLGTSGSIVVSGQTFKWLNFNITGTVSSGGGVGTVFKAVTGTDLTAGASWTGGISPLAGNIANWTNTSLSAGLTINSPISWGGICVSGAASAIGISGAGPLTLGTNGVDMSASQVNMAMNLPIVLGASQTWNINGGQSLTMSGALSGNHGLYKSGSGVLLLSNADTFSGGISLNDGILNLANVSALGASGSTLYINAAATNELSTDAAFGGTNPVYNVTLNQIGPYVGTIILNRGTVGATTAITHNLGLLTISLDYGAASGLNVLAGSNAPTGGAADTLAFSGLSYGNWYSQTETIAPTNANVIIGGTVTPQASQASSASSPQVETLALDGVSTGNQITGVINDNSGGTAYNQAAILKSNTGTWELSGSNAYSGNTTITGGTMALGGRGSIPNTPNIIVAGGATFDVSGLTSPFVLGRGQTLSNSSSSAVVKGDANTGSGTISLVYSNGSPALTVANGTLVFSPSTAFQINNASSQLAVGMHRVIAKSVGGAVGGAVTTGTVPVGGGGAAASARLAIANGELNLVVGNPVNMNPTNITAAVLGDTLNLSWPADHLGWTLQTNSVGLAATNQWFPCPGSSLVTNVTIKPNLYATNVFYRMIYP